jgi:adenylate kinase family enzyme
MITMTEQFVSARNVSTPIITIETADPATTVRAVQVAVNEDAKKRKWKAPPVLRWDFVNGLVPLNDPGKEAMAKVLKGDPSEATINPVEALRMMQRAPETTLAFFANLHRLWEEMRLDPQVVQAIWNLRDSFKKNRRTLVLPMPHCALPSELRHDVMVLDEPLPDSDALRVVVEKLHKSADLDQPKERDMERIVSGLASLSAFEAEQVTAMSLTKSGVNMDVLMERQRKQIELTPGLTVHRGNESFDHLIGLDALVGFLRKVNAGRERPNVYVFIDEIEKILAGALGGHDSSGTSQEQLGYILSHMQDTRARGILLVGPAGVGKSAIAKAAGGEGGCWTVNYDVGAQKGGIVGQTGELTRAALKTVERIGQGRAFWIATCNRIDSLPPELRRRFRSGTWYVDLPEAEAQARIWKLYCKEHKVKLTTLPECKGWTGAEIETCVENAANMECTLEEAAEYISPVVRSSAESIDQLRNLASGRFLNAGAPGFYQYVKQDLADGIRAIALSPKGVTDLGTMKES